MTPPTCAEASSPGRRARTRSSPTGGTCSDGDGAHRHLLVGRRVARQGVVSAERPHRRGPPAPLRRALRHGRGELELLRHPDGRGRRGLGAQNARRVRLPREGVRDDDPPSGEGRPASARPARRGRGRPPGPGRPSARASCAPRCSTASTRRSSPCARPGS